jgi:Protein of unknown function (DUF1275)
MAVNEQTRFDDLLLNGSLLVLTFSTGLTDAASVLARGYVFTANMTGNVVFMALALAGAPRLSMTRSASRYCVLLHLQKTRKRRSSVSSCFDVETKIAPREFANSWPGTSCSGPYTASLLLLGRGSPCGATLDFEKEKHHEQHHQIHNRTWRG